MKRFDDEKILEIYHTRFTTGLPQHLTVAVHEAARLLVAAASLGDVRVIGPIVRWRDPPGRFGIHVQGKWHLTFAWSHDYGAHSIKLQRN